MHAAECVPQLLRQSQGVSRDDKACITRRGE